MEHQSTADRLMLTALLWTTDLNIDARKALTDEQIAQVSHWRARQNDDLQTRVGRAEAKRLANAINECHVRLARNKEQLEEIVILMAAGLLDLPGLGPITSA